MFQLDMFKHMFKLRFEDLLINFEFPLGSLNKLLSLQPSSLLMINIMYIPKHITQLFRSFLHDSNYQESRRSKILLDLETVNKHTFLD